MAKRWLSLVLISSVLLGACGDDSGDGGGDESSQTTTDQPPDTSTPDTTTADTSTPDTTTPADTTSGACDPYLRLLSAQDGAQRNTALGDLRSALDDPAVQSALDTIDAGADPAATADADNLLRDAVLAECSDAYSADVTGTDPARVADEFFAAVRDGNRAAAVPLAPANVLALFEPWEPLTPDSEVGSPRMDASAEGSFSMLLAPTVSVFCETEAGVVASCGFGE